MFMIYDFDTTLDHRKNGSFRWDLPGMPDDLIGMGTADLDYTCAPCIREALVPVAQENCYNYRQRSDEYYRAYEDFYRRKYSLDVKREWLSSVPSTIGAVRMALGIYAKPGDNVIVQTPVFNPIRWAIDGADCNLISNEMKPVNGHFEIDFDDFEAKIKKYHPSVYLIVNPHNPTGRVFTEAELKKLVDICYSNGVRIVSDEVHGLITYDGNRFIPLLALGDKAQEIGIQIMSLSKGYNIMSLPHAMISIANGELRTPWMRQIQAYSFGYATNSFAIAAVTSILKGEADEWMNALHEYLRKNMEEALALINDGTLPLTAYRPEGSFLLYVDCHNAGIGTKHLDRFFLDNAHIHLDDGLDNFGPEGEGYIRINFAVTNKVLKDALGRIRKAFHNR